MSFSKRMGLEPERKPLQLNSMDDDLRNSLWNAVDYFIIREIRKEWDRHGMAHPLGESKGSSFIVPLWFFLFKKPLDQISNQNHGIEIVRSKYFQMPWNGAYDFIEFVAGIGGSIREEVKGFVKMCNNILEGESAPYRFIGPVLTPITSEAEILSIEKAASAESDLLQPVGMHIKAALRLLSDRDRPEYRNSMKESISAVESICKIIAKNDKATLGTALDIVASKISLHKKLQDGFKAIYGYTSDTHGIRHGLKDDVEPESEDARFMLVSCSAFANYLVEKARKNGLL